MPNFKPYYRAIAIKTAWYWHKNRHEDHGTQDPGMNSHNYAHLLLTKVPKHMMEKRQPLQ
jgi:hypothetical protein